MVRSNPQVVLPKESIWRHDVRGQCAKIQKIAMMVSYEGPTTKNTGDQP